MLHAVLDLLTFCVHKISCSPGKFSCDITMVVTCGTEKKNPGEMLEIVLKNKQKLVFAKCVFACLLFGVKVLVSIFVGYFLLFGRVGLRKIIFKC